MLSPLGRITLMAIGVGLTAILVSGTIVLIAPRASPVDGVGVARPEERIRYPANAYPRLSLPGGQQQTIKSVLDIRKKMEFGSFVWNEDGVPPGQVWVRIDLARQMLSVFRAGHEIGSAVVLYGTDGKPTPTGAFTVLAKDENYYSQTYDAPMPFMLRLTEDGVAIHASNVRAGSATHGCIGVPGDFARRLFAQAKAGDAVVILPPAV